MGTLTSFTSQKNKLKPREVRLLAQGHPTPVNGRRTVSVVPRRNTVVWICGDSHQNPTRTVILMVPSSLPRPPSPRGRTRLWVKPGWDDGWAETAPAAVQTQRNIGQFRQPAPPPCVLPQSQSCQLDLLPWTSAVLGMFLCFMNYADLTKCVLHRLKTLFSWLEGLSFLHQSFFFFFFLFSQPVF